MNLLYRCWKLGLVSTVLLMTWLTNYALANIEKRSPAQIALHEAIIRQQNEAKNRQRQWRQQQEYIQQQRLQRRELQQHDTQQRSRAFNRQIEANKQRQQQRQQSQNELRQLRQQQRQQRQDSLRQRQNDILPFPAKRR